MTEQTAESLILVMWAAIVLAFAIWIASQVDPASHFATWFRSL